MRERSRGLPSLLRSLHDPELAERYRSGYAQITDAVTAQLAEAVADGLLRDDVDPAPEARILLALTGGLASDVLRGQCTADEALVLLDHQVGRLVRT